MIKKGKLKKKERGTKRTIKQIKQKGRKE